MTTYNVLDANQPNPDKLIADAARNARAVIQKAWYLSQELGLNDDEDELLLNLLSVIPLDHESNGPQL